MEVDGCMGSQVATLLLKCLIFGSIIILYTSLKEDVAFHYMKRMKTDWKMADFPSPLT